MTDAVLLFAPASADNPFEIAKRALIAKLARLPVPRISVTPHPDQFEAVGDFVAAIARANDECMAAIGKELRANAYRPFKLTNFETPFLDAVDGWALGDIEAMAEDLREEYEAEGLERVS